MIFTYTGGITSGHQDGYKFNLQLEELLLESRLGGCMLHVLRFFRSGFFGIIAEISGLDPQLGSSIQPQARGLHSIWNAIFCKIAFSIWQIQEQHEYL